MWLQVWSWLPNCMHCTNQIRYFRMMSLPPNSTTLWVYQWQTLLMTHATRKWHNIYCADTSQYLVARPRRARYSWREELHIESGEAVPVSVLAVAAAASAWFAMGLGTETFSGDLFTKLSFLGISSPFASAFSTFKPVISAVHCMLLMDFLFIPLLHDEKTDINASPNSLIQISLVISLKEVEGIKL